MFYKIALLTLFVASVSASGGYSSFSYGVSDPNTGDIKDQHEKRVGGNVVGKYSLLESDGTKRVVEYSANDATGFKAVVHKEPVASAGAVSAPLSGALAHGLPAVGSLAHGALGAGPFGGANANPWTAGATPLAHTGTLANPLAHGAVNPLAYRSAAGPYGQAGLYSQTGIHGQAELYGGYGNPLAGPLSAAGHGAPTISSYSHRIVHNGPDAFPNGGAYGRHGLYGHGGYGANGAPLTGAPLAGTALGHANPWANSAAANPWAASAGSTHRGIASPLSGYGARALGYGSQLAW